MTEYQWIQNEKPLKAWRALDMLYFGGSAVVLILILFIISSNPLIAAAELSIFFFLIGFFTYAHFRFRSICPESIGLSKKGVNLKYKNNKSKFINWKDIDNVKILGPGFPSMFGIIQGVIYYAKDKPERKADIFGEAAYEIQRNFEKYKK